MFFKYLKNNNLTTFQADPSDPNLQLSFQRFAVIAILPLQFCFQTFQENEQLHFPMTLGRPEKQTVLLTISFKLVKVKS